MQKDTGKSIEASADDCMKLFIISMMDIYLAKARLLAYIPLMVEKACENELKSAIVATGDTISTQLFHWTSIMNNLEQCPFVDAFMIADLPDLDDFLKKQLENVSGYSVDVMLIFHLTMIESNEAKEFYRLKKLVYHFHDVWMIKLLNKNIIDSLIRKKELDRLLDSYPI